MENRSRKTQKKHDIKVQNDKTGQETNPENRCHKKICMSKAKKLF